MFFDKNKKKKHGNGGDKTKPDDSPGIKVTLKNEENEIQQQIKDLIVELGLLAPLADGTIVNQGDWRQKLESARHRLDNIEELASHGIGDSPLLPQSSFSSINTDASGTTDNEDLHDLAKFFLARQEDEEDQNTALTSSQKDPIAPITQLSQSNMDKFYALLPPYMNETNTKYTQEKMKKFKNLIKWYDTVTAIADGGNTKNNAALFFRILKTAGIKVSALSSLYKLQQAIEGIDVKDITPYHVAVFLSSLVALTLLYQAFQIASAQMAASHTQQAAAPSTKKKS